MAWFEISSSSSTVVASRLSVEGGGKSHRADKATTTFTVFLRFRFRSLKFLEDLLFRGFFGGSRLFITRESEPNVDMEYSLLSN